jgi:hypothetical protein
VFYIVETEIQLDKLEKLGRLGGYVDIISSNNNMHPKLSSTVAVYLRPINSKHGFILPIDHDECINHTKERIREVLSKFTTLYTLNKKELLYHFNLQQATDISLLYAMTFYDRIDVSKEISTLNYFYNKFANYQQINKLIPISKLYESCEKCFESVREHLDIPIPSGFDFYNTTATNVFYLLEQSGLGVNYEAFNKMFSPKDPLYNTNDNVTYTSYNLYNATSRPTNAFNSVNYAAIPKTEEHRKCFRPQNDYFIELDFDGYHLRLLCDQIDFDIPSDSAHKYLAQIYFNKEEINEEEYQEAKQTNFHAIYGKIPEKWAFLEIFTKIDKYIRELWRRYENDGEVLAPISGKPFTGGLRDMNPKKLMNYIMQSLETSRNILILKEVLRYLKDKKTKVALYTYDAILFDFSKEDGKQTLEEIQKIMEQNGKYPTKFKFSENLVLD